MLGYTHCAIEASYHESTPQHDGTFSGGPNRNSRMAWASYEMDGPVYLRLSGDAKSPVVYNEDYDLEIGKAIPLKKVRISRLLQLEPWSRNRWPPRIVYPMT